MVLHRGWVYVQLGLLLNRLGGLPISYQSDFGWNATKRTFSFVCIFSYIFCEVILKYMYTLLLLRCNHEFVKRWIWIFNGLGFAGMVLVVKLALTSGQISSIFSKIRNFHMSLDEIYCQRTDMSCLKPFWVIAMLPVYVGVMASDIYYSILFMLEFNEWHNVFRVPLLLSFVPYIVNSWTSFYNLFIIYVTEIEFIEMIIKKGSCNDKITRVTSLARETEDDSPTMYSVSVNISQASSSNSLKISSCNYQSQQLPKYLKALSDIKDFRLQVNRCYYILTIWYIFFLMSYIVTYAHLESHKLALNLPSFASNFSFVGLVFIGVYALLPLKLLLMNHQVAYKKGCLASKTIREVFKTKVVGTRNILVKVAIRSKDQYPDSPCVLHEFDITFYSILLDAAVLIVTNTLSNNIGNNYVD